MYPMAEWAQCRLIALPPRAMIPETTTVTA